MENAVPNPAPTVRDPIDEILQLNLLLDEGKSELISILEGLRGRKCLIVDPQLVGLLTQIIISADASNPPAGVQNNNSTVNINNNLSNSKFLKENNVFYVRELKNESFGQNDFISSESKGRDIPDNIIYIIRPNISIMKIISQQLKTAMKSGIKSQFHICFTPNQSTVCMHLLEEQINNNDLWERISFGEFRLGLVPYDTDLLTLEMEGVFKQCYVDGDLSSLNIIALSLHKMQSLYGIIPNIKCKGLGAKKVLQKLFRIRIEEEDSENQLQLHSNIGNGVFSSSSQSSSKQYQRSEIDTLIVLDREVDLVTPFITPLTYEGILDDIFGIENNCINVDQSLLSDEKEVMGMTANKGGTAAEKAAAAAASAAANMSNQRVLAPGEKASILLTNNDSIYAEIRDLSIERLGSFLQERAIQIRERYAAFRDNKDASISEIHDFVKKIPKLTTDFKSLNQHINIAELIKQKTDSREFRDQWQGERGMLEGELYLDQIEEMLYADVDRVMFYRILRLLCIQSLTAGGIRSNRYDAIRRTIAQVYDYQQIYFLSNLERSGILKRKDVILVDTASIWQTLRKQLRLIDDRSSNSSRAEDISYVSAGYAPLLVRLVQLLATSNWTALNDILKLLPGPLLEITQQSSFPEELTEAIQRSAGEASSAVTASGTSTATSFTTALSTSSIINYTTGIMTSAADLNNINVKLNSTKVSSTLENLY
eukprot:gene9327-12565_t